MKRRKKSFHWKKLWNSMDFSLISAINCCIMLLIAKAQVDAAIVPPTWSDPEKNPCASMPGGWQLLYWPPLKECFKIFTVGYPCPDTMELSPKATTNNFNYGSGTARNNMLATAECRCPPGTALSSETNKCHTIFERRPCPNGQYFSPISNDPTDLSTSSHNAKRRSDTRHRFGLCRNERECPEGMVFWAKEDKCYILFKKGPCSKGKLLVLNPEGLAECKCENVGPLRNYYYAGDATCHEHFTNGPCSTPGHLFLASGRCGCHDFMKQYYPDYKMCFELNTIGPCPPGHIFTLPDQGSANDTALELDFISRAKCQCREGYVPWPDGLCYRLYTRGPCASNAFLINSTNCVQNFCGKNRLYFPDQKSCYRIGSQGPCSLDQVVVFDFTVRPSIDGISYNGKCGCSGILKNLDHRCSRNNFNSTVNDCEATPGMVEFNSKCYRLYSRGPCGPGQWLEPLKPQVDTANETNSSSDTNYEPPVSLYSSNAKCVCRTGYTLSTEIIERSVEGSSNNDMHHLLTQIRCSAPNVNLAKYLNVQQRRFIRNSDFVTNSYLNRYN